MDICGRESDAGPLPCETEHRASGTTRSCFAHRCSRVSYRLLDVSFDERPPAMQLQKLPFGHYTCRAIWSLHMIGSGQLCSVGASLIDAGSESPMSWRCETSGWSTEHLGLSRPSLAQWALKATS